MDSLLLYLLATPIPGAGNTVGPPSWLPITAPGENPPGNPGATPGIPVCTPATDGGNPPAPPPIPIGA
ncbi:hypothetical protein ACUC2M_06430 [Bacillus cytotoxicus]